LSNEISRKPRLLIPDNSPLSLLSNAGFDGLNTLFIPGVEVWVTDMVKIEATRDPAPGDDQRKDQRKLIVDWFDINKHHEPAYAAVVMGLGDEAHEVSHRAGSHDVTSDPSSRFAVIRRSDRAEKMDRLQEAVASLISVDGILHRRSMVPFISVCHRKRQDSDAHLEIAIEASPRLFWELRDQGYPSFPISEWGRASELAGGGFDAVDALWPLKPEVLIEESLACDHEATMEVGLVLRDLLARLRLQAPVHGPRPHRNITRAIHSQDLEDQFELLTDIPVEIVSKWKKTDRQKLQEALVLLDDRMVSVPLNPHIPSKIMR